MGQAGLREGRHCGAEAAPIHDRREWAQQKTSVAETRTWPACAQRVQDRRLQVTVERHNGTSRLPATAQAGNATRICVAHRRHSG